MLLTYINAFHTKVSKGCLLVLESTMFLKDFSFFLHTPQQQHQPDFKFIIFMDGFCLWGYGGRNKPLSCFYQ
ncbi:hypothetical protein NXS98_00885 [Fontisphaera persica]|uniref:hypothetical protein n=1 Tax=Fontisphaera persica TaxID=2974023 RepID=UPI0024C04012|nr:hypothetical protein [Fontisphaera persica]WCJ59704.1 hypothetical protein NXS98_00885 [Fontisphaera persica]